MITLTKEEALAVLESLKCHADEGWHLLGHYGGPGGSSTAVELGKRICLSVGVATEGRDWITLWDER